MPRLDRRLRIALDAGTTSIGISTPAHGELTGDDGALEGKITFLLSQIHPKREVAMLALQMHISQEVAV